MLVFRMEHRTIRYKLTASLYNIAYHGPFQRWTRERLVKRGFDDEFKRMRSPSPPEDWFWDYADESYIFACPCLRKLLAWFTPDIQLALRNLDYVIAVYDVPDSLVLRCHENIQVAYPARHAKRVTRVKYGSHNWDKLQHKYVA